MLNQREITWYPRNAKNCSTIFLVVFMYFKLCFKQITFESHKTFSVLTIYMHYLSDNIVLSPLYSLKDVSYNIWLTKIGSHHNLAV